MLFPEGSPLIPMKAEQHGDFTWRAQSKGKLIVNERVNTSPRINIDKGGFPWLAFEWKFGGIWLFSVDSRLLTMSPSSCVCLYSPTSAAGFEVFPPPHTDQYSDTSRMSYNSFLTLFTWSSCGSYRLKGETQECPHLRQQLQIPDWRLYFWPTGYKLASHDPLLGLDSLLERLSELKEIHLLVYYKEYNNRYRLTVR